MSTPELVHTNAHRDEFPPEVRGAIMRAREALFQAALEHPKLFSEKPIQMAGYFHTEDETLRTLKDHSGTLRENLWLNLQTGSRRMASDLIGVVDTHRIENHPHHTLNIIIFTLADTHSWHYPINHGERRVDEVASNAKVLVPRDLYMPFEDYVRSDELREIQEPSPVKIHVGDVGVDENDDRYNMWVTITVS